MKGGVANISGKISSQYLSALLMAGPLTEGLSKSVLKYLPQANLPHFVVFT